jgi:hypothetical protein
MLFNTAGPYTDTPSVTVNTTGGDIIQDGPNSTHTTSGVFDDSYILVSDGVGNWWVSVRQ